MHVWKNLHCLDKHNTSAKVIKFNLNFSYFSSGKRGVPLSKSANFLLQLDFNLSVIFSFKKIQIIQVVFHIYFQLDEQSFQQKLESKSTGKGEWNTHAK